MRSLSDLREQIERIDPVNARERDSVAMTLKLLDGPGDPFSREVADHVTASAFVVSSRGVILHRHRLLGLWIQPGGHVDASEGPESAALRETLEETGLVAHHVEPVSPFHLDVHAGANGHRHYDLRYIVLAPPVDPSPPRDESPEVYWFDFAAAEERCEPALAPALAKLARWYETSNVRD